MLEIFLLLFPLFAMIGTGYVAGLTKIAKPDWVKVLNLFGYYVAFPALIFMSIAHTQISLDLHGRILFFQIAFGIGLMLMMFAITSLLNISRENRNTFTIGIYFANTGYIGLPALQIVFGDTATAEGAVIVAAMILTTFTLGVGILEKSRHATIDITAILKSIVSNPLIWAAILGSAVAIWHIPLFTTLERFISFMAGAASPVVLVALGVFMAYNHPKRQTLKLAGLLSGIKMIVIPTLFTATLFFLPNNAWLDVTYIQASMPLAVTTFAFAEIYPMNKDVVSTSILMSTLSAIVILPLVMWASTIL